MNPETHILPPLPQSWAALTWQQLCDAWTAKQRYGGNGDVASAAALLAVCGLRVVGRLSVSAATGEDVYQLEGSDGRTWKVTARELSFMAGKTMQWFNYPYGDPGKEVVKDEKGKVIEEAVPPHVGYVSPNWRDAMELPETEVVVSGGRIYALSQWRAMVSSGQGEAIHFVLPTVACNNLTWHQYRTLQALAPQLFQDGASDDDILRLHAGFLAAMLVPERTDQDSTDRFQKQHRFRYDADRSEQSQDFWLALLRADGAGSLKPDTRHLKPAPGTTADVLFCICFQVYQTAMRYYETVFPLLFQGGGKDDPLRDALTGEVDTLNAVMKYQGYSDPQQIYDANLPIILSALNTMTKEAKEIEKMNAQVKRKH